MIGLRPSAALALVALCAACQRAPAIRSFEIGEHRGRFAVPNGWTVVDQGRVVRVRKDAAEVVLQAMGPAGPDGVRQDLERVRAWWRLGRHDEAHTRVRNMQDPLVWFPLGNDRGAFWGAWASLAEATSTTSLVDVEALFTTMLTTLEGLPAGDVSAAAERALATFGHDQRRDVRSRQAVAVGGQAAIEIETWNRLSHEDARRFVFVSDVGYLLAIAGGWSASPEANEAFAAVRDSLQFYPPTRRQ